MAKPHFAYHPERNNGKKHHIERHNAKRHHIRHKGMNIKLEGIMQKGTTQIDNVKRHHANKHNTKRYHAERHHAEESSY